MDTDTQVAIRDTYLFVFDSFAVDSPVEIVDAGIANNPRHARELLAVLTSANLIATHEVNGETDVWQTENPGTYDHHTRADAENVIDNWLITTDLKPTPTATTKTNPTPKGKAVSTTKSNATPIEFKHCLCGCGENVPPKSNFRPGHDARMAGRIGKSFIAAGEIDDEVLQTLPTEALRDKAMTMFVKAQQKQANKVAAKVAKAAATLPAAPTPEPEPTPEPTPVAAKPKPTPRKRAARKATASAKA